MTLTVCFGNMFLIHGVKNIDLYPVESVSRLDRLVATFGYIKQVTGNDWLQCAAKCVLTPDCHSFFFDSNTFICQFHDTILLVPTDLTSSTTSLFYKMSRGRHICAII